MPFYTMTDHDNALQALHGMSEAARKEHAEAVDILNEVAGSAVIDHSCGVSLFVFQRALEECRAAHCGVFIIATEPTTERYLRPETPWSIVDEDKNPHATFNSPTDGNECLSGPASMVGKRYATRSEAREALMASEHDTA